MKDLTAATVIAHLVAPPGRDAVPAGAAPVRILVELRGASADRQQADLIDVWEDHGVHARGGLREN